jgi:hypothetical protein
MPRSTRALQRSGCVSAYASPSVLPQLPPKTIHLSIPSLSRSCSASFTRFQVVFSRSSAWGVLLPLPRWSKSTTCHLFGSK